MQTTRGGVTCTHVATTSARAVSMGTHGVRPATPVSASERVADENQLVPMGNIMINESVPETTPIIVHRRESHTVHTPRSKAAKRGKVMALIAVLMTIALVGTGCKGDPRRVGFEIALLAVGYLGDQIFSDEPGLGDDAGGIEDASGGGSVNGDIAALYGGTTHKASCDKEKLIEFLENPDNVAEAVAWASVLGIPRSGIGKFVRGLTSVILRRDTLVKNHGFRKGVANAFHAILEAGVAVLVDQFGTPVVRCACGNPLAVPDADVETNFSVADIQYKGPQWKNFKKGKATTVKKGKKVDTFVLKDKNGQHIGRISGTDGEKDKNVGPPASSTPSTTSDTDTTETSPDSTSQKPPPQVTTSVQIEPTYTPDEDTSIPTPDEEDTPIPPPIPE